MYHRYRTVGPVMKFILISAVRSCDFFITAEFPTARQKRMKTSFNVEKTIFTISHSHFVVRSHKDNHNNMSGVQGSEPTV